MKIKVRVPATVSNLGSGFDVFGAAIGLCNSFTTETTAGSGVSIEIINNDGSLPLDEKNLFVIALRKYYRSGKGLKIKIENDIPLAGGLGSSATAVIAGLMTGFILKNNGKTSEGVKDSIIEKAVEMEGHPDNVVPAVYGGLCISYSADGKTCFEKVNMPARLECLAVHPRIKVSTDHARKIMPKSVPMSDAVFNVSRAALFIHAVLEKKYENLRTAMEDRLYQGYRAGFYPAGLGVLKILDVPEVYGRAVSGSGPSVVAIIKKGASVKSLESRLRRFYSKKNIEVDIYREKFSSKGAEYSIS